MSQTTPNQTPITAHLIPKDNKPSGNTADPQQLLFIELSHDEMFAKITILPPATAEDKFVTVDDLHNALAKYNIVYGINHTALAEVSAKIAQHAAARNLTEMIEADLAVGTPAVKSQDAQIEYFYKKEEEDSSLDEGLPEDDEGRVDHRAGRKIDNVIRGNLLIRKTPAVPGTPGRTVTGKEIPPAPGKDIVIGMGKGVITHPENPNEFYADEDGQIVIKGGLISVQPIYEIRGDVDLSVGNVLFFGTVIVHGDVKEGFKIDAGGDLIVRGVVEGAMIHVDGNLTVAGGVIGNDNAHITCKGNALLKYIQNASVEVDGHLNVKQSIMHSRVTCDRTITVAGSKGMIVGGQIIARREINAAIIGSSFGTSTELIVGHQIDLREQILNAEEKLKEIDLNLDKTKKAIAYLKELYARRGGNLPPEKKELYTWLSRALIKLTSDSKMLSVKKTELEIKQKVFLEEKPIPRVNCSYVIYPGVKVTVNKAYLPFSDEQKYCTLTEFEGKVKIGPLKSKSKTSEKP